VAFWI